jgi:integrase
VSTLPRYLFRRKDSQNIYVRLQPPGQRVIERSLGTTDVKAAEIAAADLIKRHKLTMYGRRLTRLPQVHASWVPAYAPGVQVIDGQQVFATERELRDLTTGAVIGPNGGPAEILSPAPLDGVPSFEAYDAAKARPTPTVKNGDDALLETYLKHKGISGHREREARDMWHIFKTVVRKPLRECTRDDGRAVVAYLEDQADEPLKSATLRRKMVPLTALVSLAIEEGKHKGINPFAGVVQDRGDADRRLPFDDDDMALIRANLSRLSDEDQLLLRLLATTGVRRGEAFQIDREQTEGGVRFCVIGTKTEASRRRVPFPAELLDHLPAKITGPLFSGRADAASKRLAGFLRDIGITDAAKVLHSFRHRAQDRLRAAGVPEDVRWAVLGHEKRTIAAGYGKGFPVPMLKEAIDRIGGF